MARHFKLVGTHAIAVLARLAAKNAVKEKIRADGERLSLMPPRIISERARAYLDANPHLYREAYERALRLGLLDNRHQPDKVLETPTWWGKRYQNS